MALTESGAYYPEIDRLRNDLWLELEVFISLSLVRGRGIAGSGRSNVGLEFSLQLV
jgi:hypothetical protein